MAELGEPSYRARQIFTGMHRGLSPEELSNVSKRTAEKLSARASYKLPGVELKLTSKIDGTVKYLFALSDGNLIESVLMKYKHGNTLCISSQVGCRMGCRFCASTIGGRVRDLTPGEMLGQVIAAEKDSAERVDNIVMMGIGEPLDNYNNVVKFLRLVSCPEGLNIGLRHISLSTCGLADKLLRLAEEELPITLSISLHAHSDPQRSEIMPVNNSFNIETLLDACKSYYERTGRRISFEYTLIKGKNSSPKDAIALAERLNRALRRGGEPMPIHVNLIPVNAVRETGLAPPDRSEIAKFSSILEQHGIRATLRRTLGPDINASCGQLRRKASGGDTN